MKIKNPVASSNNFFQLLYKRNAKNCRYSHLFSVTDIAVRCFGNDGVSKTNLERIVLWEKHESDQQCGIIEFV